jgi:hypothetical protein
MPSIVALTEILEKPAVQHEGGCADLGAGQFNRMGHLPPRWQGMLVLRRQTSQHDRPAQLWK